MHELRTDEPTSGATATHAPPPAIVRNTLDSDPQMARLVQSICQDVREQTFGGVRDLEIRIDETGVVLRGRCASFYCKQLAQHAAIRLVGERPLVNEIEVW
jgi:hypothetical protein